MAKLYGLTTSLPGEAPAGLVAGDDITVTGDVTASGAVTGASISTAGNVSCVAIDFSGAPSNLDYYETGSFIGTITGCTTAPSATFKYVRIGKAVILSGSTAIEGVSNTTALTLSSLPASIRPSATVYLSQVVKDNGVFVMAGMEIGPSGTITLYGNLNGGGFTASGIKGILALSGSYTID